MTIAAPSGQRCLAGALFLSDSGIGDEVCRSKAAGLVEVDAPEKVTAFLTPEPSFIAGTGDSGAVNHYRRCCSPGRDKSARELADVLTILTAGNTLGVSSLRSILKIQGLFDHLQLRALVLRGPMTH